MIGMLKVKDKHHWRDYLPVLVYAYNCTKSIDMNFSPYYLIMDIDLNSPLTFSLVWPLLK